MFTKHIFISSSMLQFTILQIMCQLQISLENHEKRLTLRSYKELAFEYISLENAAYGRKKLPISRVYLPI